YLALIEWASFIKLFLFLTLLENIFFPWGVAVTPEPVALVIGVFALAIKLGVLALGLAILETSVAKLRLFLVPEMLSGSFLLALLAVNLFFCYCHFYFSCGTALLLRSGCLPCSRAFCPHSHLLLPFLAEARNCSVWPSYLLLSKSL